MVLPMSNSSSIDGGGRSIHMDSPAVRAVKNASTYTKVSYFAFIFSLAMLVFAIREMIISGGKSQETFF